MIHLRKRVLCFLLHSPSTGPAPHVSSLCSLRRLATTAPVAASPFSAEDYLVANCGLSRTHATKASKNIGHLKSSAKPDAVLAFLAGLGLPRSDIATVVGYDPRILCASVEETLGPRAKDLGALGLSPLQVGRIIPFARHSFRAPNVEFWLGIFGTFDKLLHAVRVNNYMLGVDIENVSKPNLALLQQCGISACEIADMGNKYSCRLFTIDPKFLQEAVERAEALGVERNSQMFRHVLVSVALVSKEDFARKVGMLQEVGFSLDDALMILRRGPYVLGLSKEKIRRVIHFLTTEVSLDASYIARRPALIMYSLERRLLPRYHLLRVLREKGLLNVELDYYLTASIAEKTFVQKFVLPYMDRVKGLVDDYASRCSRKSTMDLLGKKSELEDATGCSGKV